MNETAIHSKYWVPILGHAIKILETFEDADTEFNLQEISSRTGINKSSVFRVLFTLENTGYISKNAANRKYHLGLRIVEIARRARATRNLVQLARPYMRELRQRYQETVNLAVLQNNDIRYVEIMESSQAFRMTGEVGSRAPFHATAVGKAIAACLPDDSLRALMRGKKLPRFTRHTLTKRADYLRVLDHVRQQGYGFDNEEVEQGASCIAVPIVTNGNHAVHAMSVSGPTPRIRPNRKAIVSDLLRVAAAIAADLKH